MISCAADLIVALVDRGELRSEKRDGPAGRCSGSTAVYWKRACCNKTVSFESLAKNQSSPSIQAPGVAAHIPGDSARRRSRPRELSGQRWHARAVPHVGPAVQRAPVERVRPRGLSQDPGDRYGWTAEEYSTIHQPCYPQASSTRRAVPNTAAAPGSSSPRPGGCKSRRPPAPDILKPDRKQPFSATGERSIAFFVLKRDC